MGALHPGPFVSRHVPYLAASYQAGNEVSNLSRMGNYPHTHDRQVYASTQHRGRTALKRALTPLTAWHGHRTAVGPGGFSHVS
jgi:hypothetical protein